MILAGIDKNNVKLLKRCKKYRTQLVQSNFLLGKYALKLALANFYNRTASLENGHGVSEACINPPLRE